MPDHCRVVHGVASPVNGAAGVQVEIVHGGHVIRGTNVTDEDEVIDR